MEQRREPLHVLHPVKDVGDLPIGPTPLCETINKYAFTYDRRRRLPTVVQSAEVMEGVVDLARVIQRRAILSTVRPSAARLVTATAGAIPGGPGGRDDT